MPMTPMSPVHTHNAHQWRQLEVRGESPTIIAAAAAALRSRRASSFEHDYNDDHSHDHDHELSLSGDTGSLQAAFLTAAEAAVAETIAQAMGDVAGVVRVHESELIPPSPRSGHVAVLEGALPQTDIEPRMWVYGGFSTSTGEHEIFRELYCYHTLRNTWQRVATTGPPPSATCSQSVVVIGSSLVFFGGTSFPFGRTNSNEVTLLDLRTLVWKSLTPTGTSAPLPRFGQSLTYDSKRERLYVLGGTNGHIFYCDLWFFDLHTLTWHEVDVSEDKDAPPAGYKHEAILHDDRILLIGGGAPFPVEDSTLETIYELNLSSHKWRKIKCKGSLPDGRRSHACQLYNNSIYLLGGVSLTSVFSDLWRLDLATYTWIDVGESIGGEAPPPSFFHSVVCTRTGELIKFGGVLDLDSRTRTNSVHKLDICPGSVSSLLNMCCEYLSREDVLTPSALVRSELPMYFVDAVLPYLPPSTSSFCAA